MQKQQTLDIFCYPKSLQKERQQYLEAMSVEQFKKIPINRIQRQFKVLSSADLLSEELLCTIPTNMNRYTNILTYQHNRLIIPNVKQFYVNASLMKSLVDNNYFVIFCQAPVPDFHNFWQAVYHKDVNMIIMLCMFLDPRRGRQADQYWPELDKQLKYKGLVIKTVQQQKLDTDFVRSVFSVIGDQGQKKVQHYHWTGWSDMKAPVGSTLHILQRLVQIVTEQVDKAKPLIIHCSAGVGRTGTLAALVQAKRLVRQKKALSVFAIIENFRKHRYGCIQTFQQYSFIYRFLQKQL